MNRHNCDYGAFECRTSGENRGKVSDANGVCSFYFYIVGVLEFFLLINTWLFK